MENRWSAREAAGAASPIDLCAYGSRLLGAEPSLVLHGGGNASVKVEGLDLFGDPEAVLWVKGSGSDMASIEADGFCPLRHHVIRRLATLDELSDVDMANALRTAKLDAAAPSPSVEAIVHAVIPHPFVFHTHSSAVLAISNTPDGIQRLGSLYGERVVVVDYARPGFRIGRAVAAVLDLKQSAQTIGVVLANHGLVSFGETAEIAYGRMIELVSAAEELLATARPAAVASTALPAFDRLAMAQLRHDISAVAGRPFVATRRSDERCAAFAADPDRAALTAQGPATPDHVIWTKTRPLFGRDVATYADAYRVYFAENAHRAPGAIALDPAPRIVLDEALGVVAAGPDVLAADRAADLFAQTLWCVEQAGRLDRYQPVSPSEFFDLEYWDLEQAKLRRPRKEREFTGEVAVVTGAASGIGRACALDLLAKGAAVVGLDRSDKVHELSTDASFLGVVSDVTSHDDMTGALDAAVARFGGVDLLVASAGLFPESSPIARHDPVAWRRAMSINVDALVELLAMMHPLLKLSPRGGRVAIIGSKNVAAPGPGASAYSASKAAANQIARVAALEWAPDRIRINSVHPDAVFDTGLWTPELLAERAKRYGMSIEQYKRRNLLAMEITSANVATVVSALLSSDFAAVTGGHVPIDGGNDRVI